MILVQNFDDPTHRINTKLLINLSHSIDTFRAEKIVTEEQLKAYVEEMAHAVLKKPMELAEKYRQTLQGLLSPGESAGTD